MFKKIKLYLKHHKVVHSFKSLLASGFFVINPRDKTFEQVTFLKCLKSIFKFKIVAIIFGKGNIKAGRYSYGDSKMVLIIENKAFIKYKDRHKFVSFVSKIDVLNLLPYSFPEINQFNYKEKMIVESTVHGINPNDSISSIKDFVNSYNLCFRRVPSIQLPINDDKSIYLHYIFQHGDFGHNNVFINPGKLTVVDLDSINLYPLFYDLFFFLFLKCNWSITKTLMETSFIFDECEKIAEKFNFILTNDLYLCYLEAFIYSVTSEKEIYNRFVFANELLTKINSLNILKLTAYSRRINKYLNELVSRKTNAFEKVNKKEFL